MQITPQMRKALKPFADENPQFTHAIVYTDPAGADPWKFEGFKNYCAAQAETVEFVQTDIDFVMVNLVTL